jgi:hypothetical protein
MDDLLRCLRANSHLLFLLIVVVADKEKESAPAATASNVAARVNNKSPAKPATTSTPTTPKPTLETVWWDCAFGGWEQQGSGASKCGVRGALLNFLLLFVAFDRLLQSAVFFCVYVSWRTKTGGSDGVVS